MSRMGGAAILLMEDDAVKIFETECAILLKVSPKGEASFEGLQLCTSSLLSVVSLTEVLLPEVTNCLDKYEVTQVLPIHFKLVCLLHYFKYGTDVGG